MSEVVNTDISTHYDGYGLNESIDIRAMDDLGPGGAHHLYAFLIGPDKDPVGHIQFQRGPRNEVDSTPGVTEAAVISVLIHRLEAFQASDYACDENRRALDYMYRALFWMKERTAARARRGVLGTNAV